MLTFIFQKNSRYLENLVNKKKAKVSVTGRFAVNGNF